MVKLNRLDIEEAVTLCKAGISVYINLSCHDWDRLEKDPKKYFGPWPIITCVYSEQTLRMWKKSYPEMRVYLVSEEEEDV